MPKRQHIKVVKHNYGSEGWGFESLRARETHQEFHDLVGFHLLGQDLISYEISVSGTLRLSKSRYSLAGSSMVRMLFVPNLSRLAESEQASRN